MKPLSPQQKRGCGPANSRSAFFHPDTLRAQQPLRAATAENRQSARNPIRKITPFVDTIAPLVYFNWTCTREWVALRQNRTK